MEGAARVFDDKTTSVDKDDIRLFLGAWTAFDPEGALESVLDWTPPSLRRLGVGVIAREWAEHGNALEAIQHLRELGEWKTRDPAFAELLNGWIRSGDIEGATEFVAGLPDSDGRDILLAAMMKGILLDHGIEGLMRWSDAVPVDSPGKFKKKAFRKALRQVSNRDPVRAAAWYEEQEHEDYAPIMMAVVAAEWVELDPEAAIAWVLARPAESEHGYALNRLMYRWVHIDSEAATEWMQNANLDGELSSMLDPFIRGLAVASPEEASAWIDRVDDPKERERLIITVGSSWGKIDQAAADAWLDELDLPEETRLRIAKLQMGTPSGRQLVIPEEQTP